MFENINIVLLETSHPGNIGATARAMKVMGLNKLSLVDPKDFPSDDSFALAVGCKDVLRKAKIFKNLSDSLEESEINIGFSSRRRKAKVPKLTIDQCVDLINMNPKKKISILFGNEQSGLSNKEINVDFSYVSTTEEYRLTALTMFDNLRKIGINTKLKPGLWSTNWEKAKNIKTAPNIISMAWWPTY